MVLFKHMNVYSSGYVDINLPEREIARKFAIYKAIKGMTLLFGAIRFKRAQLPIIIPNIEEYNDYGYEYLTDEHGGSDRAMFWGEFMRDPLEFTPRHGTTHSEVGRLFDDAAHLFTTIICSARSLDLRLVHDSQIRERNSWRVIGQLLSNASDVYPERTRRDGTPNPIASVATRHALSHVLSEVSIYHHGYDRYETFINYMMHNGLPHRALSRSNAIRQDYIHILSHIKNEDI